ncbi:DUF2927 domain-containing protein [Flagellimonas sp.]|uniref:DUF2927 domain-containing protein n=1 Tax=Flagellimonas sp. TaxID=2058762 RepID=UPI003F4A41E7
MNLKNRFYLVCLSSIFIIEWSCTKDENSITAEQDLNKSELTESETVVISYFKEIALGFENGNSAEIIRKWSSPMRVFIAGNASSTSKDKVEQTIDQINELVTDGFSIEIVTQFESHNCLIFFGTKSEFLTIYPEAEGQIGSNFAIFNVWWNNNNINRARIFIDSFRVSKEKQESLIIEEITQILGLGKDSSRFPNSIFYETPTDGGFASEYADIDKELIRLLYHPSMKVGLNEEQVDLVLKEILMNE